MAQWYHSDSSRVSRSVKLCKQSGRERRRKGQKGEDGRRKKGREKRKKEGIGGRIGQ